MPSLTLGIKPNHLPVTYKACMAYPGLTLWPNLMPLSPCSLCSASSSSHKCEGVQCGQFLHPLAAGEMLLLRKAPSAPHPKCGPLSFSHLALLSLAVLLTIGNASVNCGFVSHLPPSFHEDRKQVYLVSTLSAACRPSLVYGRYSNTSAESKCAL